MEYQYLKTYTTLYTDLSKKKVIYRHIYNANMTLKQKCMLLY